MESPHIYAGLTLGQAFELSLANGSSRTTTDFWGRMKTYGAFDEKYFWIDSGIFRVLKRMTFGSDDPPADDCIQFKSRLRSLLLEHTNQWIKSGVTPEEAEVLIYMGNALEIYLHPDRIGIENHHVTQLDLSECFEKKQGRSYAYSSLSFNTTAIAITLSKLTKVRELLLHTNELTSFNLERIVKDLVSPDLVMVDLHNNELDDLNQLCEGFGSYEGVTLNLQHNQFRIRLNKSLLPLDDRLMTVNEIREFLALLQRKNTEINENLKIIAQTLGTQLKKQKVFKPVTVSKRVHAVDRSVDDFRFVPLTINRNLQIEVIYDRGGKEEEIRPVTKDSIRLNIAGLNLFDKYRKFEFENEGWINYTGDYIPEEDLATITINTLQTSLSFEKREEEEQISSKDIAAIASRIAALKQMDHEINKEAALKLIVTCAEPVTETVQSLYWAEFQVALIGGHKRIASPKAKELVKKIVKMHGYGGIIEELIIRPKKEQDDSYEFDGHYPRYETYNIYLLSNDLRPKF